MEKKATILLITNEKKQEEKKLIKIINNKINYIDGNTNVLFDITNEILIRENSKMYLEYNFKNNKAEIYIKELLKSINLNLITKNKIIKDNYIEIEYIIEEDKYKYIIDMR